jgi:hypothetical protein
MYIPPHISSEVPKDFYLKYKFTMVCRHAQTKHNHRALSFWVFCSDYDPSTASKLADELKPLQNNGDGVGWYNFYFATADLGQFEVLRAAFEKLLSSVKEYYWQKHDLFYLGPKIEMGGRHVGFIRVSDLPVVPTGRTFIDVS